MPSISYEYSVNFAEWEELYFQQIIDSAISSIQKHCPDISGEVSILLTNDEEIQELNKTYRGKDKPTNVLSFPQNEEGLLGDIAMALETLRREAVEQEKTLQEHFTHLFVHGVLHLSGYDHEHESDQRDMEQQEVKILHEMGISNPYEFDN